MKRTLHFLRWSFWAWCFALLMTGGIYASYTRFAHGIDHSLSNVFPWGLITGLDVFCGIAIATGGFTVAASIYVLNLEGYRSVVRTCLVTGCLGYVIAVLGMFRRRDEQRSRWARGTRTRFSMESHGLSFFLVQP